MHSKLFQHFQKKWINTWKILYRYLYKKQHRSQKKNGKYIKAYSFKTTKKEKEHLYVVCACVCTCHVVDEIKTFVSHVTNPVKKTGHIY